VEIAENAVQLPISFVRVGTWFWIKPTDLDTSTATSDLMDALRADSRVLQVVPPEATTQTESVERYYPDAPRTTADGILRGNDGFEVTQIPTFIRFSVRVPVKNQPWHDGFDDVPTDTYFVAWDGLVAYVLWHQSEDDYVLSAGQIVGEILSEATESSGGELYIQNCSPGCHFMFAHRTMRVAYDPDVEYFDLIDAKPGSPVVELTIPGPSSPMDELGYLAVMLRGSISGFATFKNFGRRLIDLERAVRVDSSHVLNYFHSHAALVARGKRPPVLLERWKSRGWRAKARALVARSWLGMANMETLRRSWDEERDDWMSFYPETLGLLQSDYSRDIANVEQLNMEPVADTITRVSTGLDNRTVVLATAWGAVAGGVVGGLAGLLGR
jgi:hypothetical protein